MAEHFFSLLINGTSVTLNIQEHSASSIMQMIRSIAMLIMRSDSRKITFQLLERDVIFNALSWVCEGLEAVNDPVLRNNIR